jgi:hypothetical protein
MPQAVKIVSQTQQQCLAALREQASAWSTTGQFALGNPEDSLDQGTAAIFLTRKIGTHLRTNAMNGPRLFPTLGGDDAEGMKLLTNKGVIPLGVELGIGQHTADRSLGMRLRDQAGQVGTVVPGGLTRRLRQNELPLQIDHRQPLQPMAPRAAVGCGDTRGVRRTCSPRLGPVRSHPPPPARGVEAEAVPYAGPLRSRRE